MNLSLEGKNAVICGSTQGIGLAIAEELALLGANCSLMARNADSLQSAVQNLDTSLRQEHHSIVADFHYPEQVEAAIVEHLEQHEVHILVNNSGGPAAGPIVDAEIQQFIDAFNQHVICSQILARAVVPSMKQARYGRIINIISTSVKVPLKNLGVSNTIRGAMASWSKTLANELGQYQITVNNILPGPTSTKRLSTLIDTMAARSGSPADQVKATMIAEVPLKRFAEASEVAAVAAFLASPAASFVNGVSIPVDGGRTGSI